MSNNMSPLCTQVYDTHAAQSCWSCAAREIYLSRIFCISPYRNLTGQHFSAFVPDAPADSPLGAPAVYSLTAAHFSLNLNLRILLLSSATQRLLFLVSSPL